MIKFPPTRRILSLAFLFFLITLFFERNAGTQSQVAPSKPKQLRAQSIPGELLVRFRSEATAREQSKSTRLRIDSRDVRMSVEKIVDESSLSGLRLVRVDSHDTHKAIESLKKRSDVLYAEPNFLRYKLALPNDPLFANLWGLRNNGFLFGSPGLIPGHDIDAELAWNITTGSRDVVVGVVDGGVDVNHIDLQQNIWKNPLDQPNNGLDEDGNGVVDDFNGFDFFHNQPTVFDPAGGDNELHGTHVAGTIGAVGNNSIGVTGVNWEVSLMSLKVLGRDFENPNASSVGVLVRAYSYAKKMRELWISSGGTKGANIRILNNSIGGYGRSQAEEDIIEELNDAGILFVAASGNFERNNDTFPMYPASYDAPNIISVAATVFNDTIASFSNVGARTVTMTAPGFITQSTAPFNSYAVESGTSMASPHVAGVAALICAKHPNIGVEKLKASLIYNGEIIPSQLSKTLTGRRLNAFNSLNAAAENDNTPPAPLADFRLVTQNGRTLTLGWKASGDDGNTGKTSLYDIRYSDTDPSSPAAFEAATPISPLGIPLPSVAGSFDSAVVEVPFRHTRGFIGIRTTDNLGNNSPISVVPVIAAANAAQVYDVTQSPSQPLSTGGTEVLVNRDDIHFFDHPLPFAFPFFGHWARNITVSSNGTLYFSTPPKFLLPPVTGLGEPLDAFSSIRALQTNMMIAGMWDDLVTSVYAVTPDSERIIFRWEGKTFDTPFEDGTSRGEHPVNFEIELRKNGTIVIRYGNGNEKLFPVVGISGGSPDAYVVNSHTSEAPFLNLTNANTLTFAPRFTPAPTSADVQVRLSAQAVAIDTGGASTALPAAILQGQTLQYTLLVENMGPDASDNVVLTGHLAPGTSFVGCVGAICSGPPPGSNGGAVKVQMGVLGQTFDNRLNGASIQVLVNAPPGTTLASAFTAAGSTSDPNPFNNEITVTTLVASLTPLRDFLAVDGSRTFSVGVKTDGTVWVWGIPPGSPESAVFSLTTPRRVEGLSNVVAVAAGFSHVLALKSDGTVWSWGINTVGQLGNQPIANSFTPFPPKQIPGLPHIKAIAAADNHSLVLTTTGVIWGWGEDPVGQPGGGFNGIPFPTPVENTTISNVKAISAGSCTYAIKEDGSAWSWGDTPQGRCGTGVTALGPLVWLPVANISNVRQIKGEFNHSVAVLNDGTVWAWGSNSQGQHGSGNINDSLVPVRAGALTNVIEVAAATDTCIALKSDGTVWSWGNHQLTPIQLGLANIKTISAWTPHAAIATDDTLLMWGSNIYGNLGDGTFLSRNTPEPVQTMTVVATPVFNPGPRMFVFPQDVTITCETAGAVIHYTMNGIEPTESDPVVNSGGSVKVSQSGLLWAKAFRSGWTPSKLATATYIVLAVDPASIVQLLLDAPGNEVAALDATLLLRGPFSVRNEGNLLNRVADKNTRVSVFVRNLQLFQGAIPPVVKIELYDANSVSRQVTAENILPVANTDLVQVTFRLPDNLPAGNYTVVVNALGQTSNAGMIAVKP